MQTNSLPETMSACEITSIHPESKCEQKNPGRTMSSPFTSKNLFDTTNKLMGIFLFILLSFGNTHSQSCPGGGGIGNIGCGTGGSIGNVGCGGSTGSSGGSTTGGASTTGTTGPGRVGGIRDNQGESLSAVATYVYPVCTSPTGAITMSPTGGTTPYTYLWSNGDTTSMLRNLVTGNYTVTVTDHSGHTVTRTFALTAYMRVMNLSTTAAADTCNSSRGKATVTVVSNGQAPYRYLWSNGASTALDRGLIAGAYSVTVADSNGCLATARVSLSNIGSAITQRPTISQPVCPSGNGSISLSPTGGTSGTYRILWSNSSTSNTITAPAGTYTATVSGTNGCSSTASYVISSGPSPISANATIISPICRGSRGSISISPSGGNGPTYTAHWSNGGSGMNITNLNPGQYTVTITDHNSCSAAQTLTMDSGAIINTSANVTLPICTSANGSIQLNSSNGKGPYHYQWSGGDTSANKVNLSAGTYNVTVTDANSCSSTRSFTITATMRPVTLSTTSISDTCGSGKGGASVSVTSANSSSPFTYIWSNTATASTLSGLTANTYGVSVTDANGCSASSSATVSNYISTISANPAITNPICTAANGSIILSPSGGKAPYSYLWSTGPRSSGISNLAGGTYTATVTDANYCSTIQSFTLTPTVNTLSLNSTSISDTCGSGRGSASVSIAGGSGTGPFSYRWSIERGTAYPAGLVPGTYIVTVTDGNGCTGTSSVTVSNYISTINANPTSANPICTSANGSIQLSPSGGKAPYKYIWSTRDTTASVSNLGAGTYTATVTDANSCSAVQSVTLSINQRPVTLATTSISDTCGSGKGSASVSVTSSASVSPFTFAWSNGSNTNTANHLAPNSYSVSVADANGCSAIASVSVGNYVYTFSANITNSRPICTNPNGTLQISASGGRSPYSFRWNTGDSVSSISGLAAGSYAVTITDANTCTVSRAQTLAVYTPAVTASASAIGDTCNAHIGSVSSAIVGGTAPYSYLWSNGGTSATITGLGAHYYSFVATDINGCTATAGASVSNLGTAIVINATVLQPLCHRNTGRITISLSGGTSSSYNAIWSNGSSATVQPALTSGNYSVTVTGTNGCIASQNFTITLPDSINLSYTTTPVRCDSAKGGMITQSAMSGANYPWTIAWTGPAGYTSSSMSLNHLFPGTYSYNLTDAKGCTAQGSYTLAQTGPVSTTYVVANTTCPGVSNGSIQRTSLIPYSSPTFHWTGPAGYTSDSTSIKNVGPGVYTLVVTEPYGCTATITDTVYSGPAVSMQYLMTPVKCDSAIGGSLINTSATNTNAPWSISWTGPNNYASTSTSINRLAGGQYTLQFTDGRGCSATQYFRVDSFGALSANYNANNITCHGASNGAVNYLSLRPYSSLAQYQWTGPNGYSSFAQSISGLAPGAYTVTVSEDFGCKAVNNYNISEMFDIGVASIKYINCPAPGIHMIIHPIAGDISQLNGNHCAAGVSGRVTMIVSGPIHYEGVNNSALAPVVNGDTLTWSIQDFGTVRIDSSFFAQFFVDSTAVLGGQICINVQVTPTNGDYNPSNNNLSTCLTIIQAYDPNQKQVFPQGDIPADQKTLTYTIQFQNIGTGPAQHVYIHDTLDASIDPASLIVLASSYPVQTIANGNALKFDFVNINLSPASVNPDGSNGWIQYKVKLRDQLSIGTQILNTAHIYFDYNDPMATNTTVNRIVSDESTGIATIGKNAPQVILYPDPAHSYIYIKSNLDLRSGYIEMYDTEGRKCKKLYITDQNIGIDISDLAQGMYTVNLIYSSGQNIFKKMIIER